MYLQRCRSIIKNNCQMPFIEYLLHALSYLTFTAILLSGCYCHNYIMNKEAEICSHRVNSDRYKNQ